MLKRQLRLIVLAGIATLIVLVTTVSLAYREYAQLRQEAALADDLSHGIYDLQFLTTEYLATRTPRTLRQWQSRHARLSELLDRSVIHDDGVLRLMPEIRTRVRTLSSIFSKLVRRAPVDLSVERADTAERAIVTRLLNQILALATLRSQVADIFDTREQKLYARLPVVVGLIFVIGVVMALFLYARVVRDLSRNLFLLSNAIIRIGSGNISDPIDTSSPGEFQESFEALEQSRARLADAIRQMEQEQADLDHFVYVASHDFKAPLRGIDNLAAWIEEDAGTILDEQTIEHLHLLRGRVSRLETLLDDLLAYSRAGRTKVAAETVNVEDLLNELVGDLSLPSGFTVEYESRLPVILSPKVPLRHIFRNLISNAVKHHDHSEGKIVIEAAEDPSGKGYAFRVTDDGPGIPEKYRKRIFELFQTLKPRDEIEGSGMGLAIAKRLVENYNGEIYVVGGNGRGSTFEFTWFPERKPENES